MLRFTCVVLAAAVMFGCDAGNASVRSGMLVSTQWLATRTGQADVVICHVAANRDIYSKTHIPGARFIAWSEVAADRDGVANELPPLEDLLTLMTRLGIAAGDRIVLYDEEGGLSAARAYVAFDYLGLGDRCSLLDGQLKKWQAEGRPLTDELPAAKPASFTPRLQPQIILSLTAMKDAVWARNNIVPAPLAIIDARPDPEYSGQSPGKNITRGGHIPGAASVPSTRNVNEGIPTFRPELELRSLYAQAGVQPGMLTIAYCRTGAQASLTYFVLKYLRVDVRLYDGSYLEWSAQKDLPVATR